MRILSTIGIVAIIAVMVVAIYLFAQPVMTWFADLGREVTQQSQQYTEAKVSLLLDLIEDHEDPTATEGQRGVIVSRFCEEATRIDRTEWPRPVLVFYGEEC